MSRTSTPLFTMAKAQRRCIYPPHPREKEGGGCQPLSLVRYWFFDHDQIVYACMDDNFNVL